MDAVQVFHVRHRARKPLTHDELDELMDDEWRGFDQDFRFALLFLQ